MPLRSGLIRLAYENPELRPVLLPLLAKQAAKQGDLLKVVKAMRFHPGNRRKTITLPVGATVELIDDNVGGGAWAVLFPAGLPKAEWDGHVFPIFKSDHGNFVPVEGRQAAAAPAWAKDKKFKHPTTGNDVVFGSLPAEERKRLSEKHAPKKEQKDPNLKVNVKKNDDMAKKLEPWVKTLAYDNPVPELEKVLDAFKGKNDGKMDSDTVAGAYRKLQKLHSDMAADYPITRASPKPPPEIQKQLDSLDHVAREVLDIAATAQEKWADNLDKRKEKRKGKTAATDPKQAVKSVYKDHERDFKSLHARIVDMKKDSSFNSLKAKTDLNVVLESLDMLKKAGSVEDYAEHAQAIEAACGKVLAKSKADGLDDLLPLVKDVQKGAKAVAAKAGE